MSRTIIGPAAAAKTGCSASWTAVSAGIDAVPPPVSSWARGSKPRKSPRTAAATAATDPGLLLSSVVTNRTLMARNPTAMTRTTSRLGTRPSFSAAEKAFQVKDRELSAKARVRPEASTAERIAAGPFRDLGRNIPVAIAMCFFSRAVTAAAMKVAARTRCSTQTPEFLQAGVEAPCARRASTRSRTARAKMDKKGQGILGACGRRGRAYWPRAFRYSWTYPTIRS